MRVTCEARPAPAGWRDSCKLHGHLTFFVELFCLFVDLFGLPHCRKHARIVTKHKSSSRACSAENFLVALLSFLTIPIPQKPILVAFFCCLFPFLPILNLFSFLYLFHVGDAIKDQPRMCLVITISFYNEETRKKKHHYPAATQGQP